MAKPLVSALDTRILNCGWAVAVAVAVIVVVSASVGVCVNVGVTCGISVLLCRSQRTVVVDPRTTVDVAVVVVCVTAVVVGRDEMPEVRVAVGVGMWKHEQT